MNISFEIVELQSGPGGHLYSVKMDGEKFTEYEKFENNKDFKKLKDYYFIVPLIEAMVEELGFRSQFFEFNESGMMDNVCAIYERKQKLRLYCIRNGDILLVAGYGGIKETRTYQENPELNNSVELLAYVDKRLFERTLDPTSDLNFDKETGELIGNLKFDKE